MRATLTGLLLLAIACGGSSGSSAECTIKLSGAVTDSITCSRVAAEFNGTTGFGGFGVTASGTTAQLSLAVTTDGQPTTGTFISTSDSTVSVTNAGQTWQAAGPSVGSFNLTITDLGSATTIGGNTGWPSVHGSLNAVLQPQGGATGTVSVQASF